MDEYQDLVLEQLRAMRGQISALDSKVGDVMTRMTSIESSNALLLQHIVHLTNQGAAHQVALDKLNARQERTEKRLEIHD